MSESGSGHYFLTPGQLKTFTQALIQALYDHAIEEHRTVRYYYDADIVVWMVLGLFGDVPPGRNNKEDLIRALLSAGFLGKVFVLRPHALELRNRIADQEETAARIQRLSNSQSFRDRIVRYFGERKILERLESLDLALKRARTKSERLKAFLSEIKTSGPETFIAYELARGNWQEKLATLSASILQFEHFGEDIEKILDENPEVWELNEAITLIRELEAQEHGAEKSRRPTSMNDLSDALALTTLGRLIMASQDDAAAPEVRFHTNTPRLLRAATGTTALASRFRYPLSQGWKMEKSWDADLIFRSTEYYILRASFKALHFGKTSDAADGEVTIADLEGVRRELVNAWRQYEQPSDRADAEKQLLSQVEAIRIGSGTLRESLIEIERASFLARLLKEYKVPRSLTNILAKRKATDVFSSEETNTAAARLLKDAKQLTADLADRLTGIDKWFGPTRDIILAVNRLSRTENNFEITDAIRDLGLVRWGADPDQAEIDEVVTKARSLFSKKEHLANRAAADLSREVERPSGGESRALANAGLLWQLGQFELVTRLINRCENRDQSLPLSLKIMRKAARLRSEADYSGAENTRLVRQLLRAAQEIKDDTTRGRHFIGLAYITFYIAFSEGRGESLEVAFDKHSAREPIVTKWAKRSFLFAEHAMELLEGDHLARAFAINHAAYVGILYKIQEIRTERYLRELRELREITEHSDRPAWNYRFADTVAIAAYRAGYDAWKSSVTQGEHGLQNEPDACARLAEAEDILQTAFPHFGDSEIPGHRQDIQRLQKLIGCPPPPLLTLLSTETVKWPLPKRRFVLRTHELNVLLRLAIGRHAVVLLHGAGSGVVGGEGEIEIAVEGVEQGAEIADAAEHVLFRVEDVVDADEAGRGGHELHHAAGADR